MAFVAHTVGTLFSGMAYRCVVVMMVAIARKNVGKKKPSRACKMDFVRVPGCRMKRVTRPRHMEVKMKRFSAYKTIPMVLRPWNWCGCM
jgi:hypothetical protein